MVGNRHRFISIGILRYTVGMTKTRNIIMFGGGTVLLLLIAIVAQQMQVVRLQRENGSLRTKVNVANGDIRSLQNDNRLCLDDKSRLVDEYDGCVMPEPVSEEMRKPYQFIPRADSDVITYDQQTSPATTTVRYINREKGISIDLPYSYYWGTSWARVAPFDELDGNRKRTDVKGDVNTVMFGPYQTVEGGEDRVLALSFEHASSTEDVNTRDSRSRQVKRIGSLQVVEYDDGGDMCIGDGLVVIGKKYNYRLSTFCGAFSLEQLEIMVKSIKLVE